MSCASYAATFGSVAVVPEVEVVDDREVVGRDAETLEALLVRAHDPVVGVVEHDRERVARRPTATVSKVAGSAGDLSQRPTFDDRTNWSRGKSRRPAPIRISDSPRPYHGAVSNRRRPSAQPWWTVARASSSDTRTAIDPIGAPPSPSWVTRTPVRPSSRVARGSIAARLLAPVDPRHVRRPTHGSMPAHVST